MQQQTLSGIPEFLTKPLWETDTMLFRGVADAQYALVPSIGRIHATDEESRQEFEMAILREFQRRALPFLKFEPKSPLEWMFLAQHYSLPTRLLDWTTNPLVALYFACEKHPERDCAIYKQIQSRWLEGFHEGDPFELKEVFGLKPNHSDVRYVNQDGTFTIHPNPTEALDGNHIVKYVFPAEAKEQMRWQLQKFGFRASYIYPGLDGVAKDVVEESNRILRGRRLRTSGSLFET